MSRLYIAYGSNMNVEQMAYRCPDAELIGVSTLPNMKLTFRGNGHNGVANIEDAESGSVPVVVWRISKNDEKSLDIYEGCPRLYVKKRFVVRIGDSFEDAMAYVMTPGHSFARPSAGYLETIAEGYDHFGIDAEELFKAAVECNIKGGLI